MNFKNNMIKTVTFLIVALLFFSFKFSEWEYDKNYRSVINKSITKIFNSHTYKLEELKNVDDAFYVIKEGGSISGYIVVANAPSKFHQFDYYIIFNKNADILKIEILKYRENYGAEICSKKWLEKFIKIPINDYVEYNRKVDGISGATISVNSVKKDVFNLSNTLKKSIDEIEKN